MTSLLRGLARAARRLSSFIELHGIRIGAVDCAHPSGKTLHLWAAEGDHLANLLWWRGWDGYEPASTRPWVQLSRRATTIVDIGANIGIFTLLAAAANPDAHVFAFEPMSKNFEELQRNAHLNPELKITCVRAAVAATEGEVVLNVHNAETFDCQASIAPDTQLKAVSMRQETCPQTSLDDYCRLNGVAAVGLIKIDVEGAEPLVLAGMGVILARDRPDIIVEILNEEVAAAVAAVALAHGYTHFLLTSDGPVVTTSVRPDPRCLNHLLTQMSPEEVVAISGEGFPSGSSAGSAAGG